MNYLKRITSLLVLSALFVFQAAANDPVETATTEFEVNGLKVILKNVPKEIISARLFISGGTANYPKEQEGIEGFALRLAVSGGTTSMDKLTFITETEKIGASISAGTDYDFGTINLSCTKQFWDKSWNLYAETIMNPGWDEDEFGIIKEQLITQARVSQSDPDNHLRNLAMSNVFEGRNYAKIPQGTPESIEKLTLDDLKAYYAGLIGKKRSFLVVVGDISEEDLRSKVEKSLGNLQDGTLPAKEELYLISDAKVHVEDRDIETNYIRGYMSAPALDHEDGVAMWLAMSILRERYFVELRTKRSLSYAPSAFYATGILNNPYNAIYISTTDPKQSMEVMVDEINKLKTDGFSEKELTDRKQTFLTTHYMGLERMASQSSSLGLAQMRGDWKMAEELTDRVNAVTLDDLNRVIKKYTDIISWTYLGKKDMVSEEDFLQPTKLPEDASINRN